MKKLILWLSPLNLQSVSCDDSNVSNEIKFINNECENWKIEHSPWYTISEQLENIYDPVNHNNYKPLQLNIDYWSRYYETNIYGCKSKHNSKYKVCYDDTIEEIMNGNMKYRPTMELLYQSNPTLIPVINYQNFNVNDKRLSNLNLKMNISNPSIIVDTDGFHYVSNCD